MDRNRQIAIAVGIALVAFLLGFVPQWMRAERSSEGLQEARWELQAAHTEGKIGAALTESLRSNYERARQLMTEVYAELQSAAPRLEGAQRREVDALLAGRDEMITLLARAAPESSQRLMLLYTRYHNAFHPEAAAAAASTTPVKARSGGSRKRRAARAARRFSISSAARRFLSRFDRLLTAPRRLPRPWPWALGTSN